MDTSSPSPPAFVGEAVLRDFPVRIWHRQFEHTQGLLREFQLLVSARPSGAGDDVPARLLEMAALFISRYGGMMDELTAQRMAAFEAGLVKFDSVVPLPAETLDIIPRAVGMIREVDDYCREGNLLSLATPPDVAALQKWTTTELVAQFQGATPTPWAGPFD